jgi:hypothetical protein
VPGKVTAQGKGDFEYHLKLPESVAKARPESLGLYVETASRAGRAKVDWPERTNPQDDPQTEARKWPSTLQLTVNGHALGRADLPDDPTDARGVLSHQRRVDHGSHGELVALGGMLPESVRDELAAGTPLVLRLSVPDDAPHDGGLSLYGAGMGAYPSDPSLLIRTREPLLTDLGVKADEPLAFDTFGSRQTVLVASGDSGPKPATWGYTTTDPGPGWAEPASTTTPGGAARPPSARPGPPPCGSKRRGNRARSGSARPSSLSDSTPTMRWCSTCSTTRTSRSLSTAGR